MLPSESDIRAELANLKTRVGILEEEVVENTKITTDLRDELRAGIGKDLKEMVEMFGSLKGGLKVMGWLGTLTKWISGLGAAFAVIYAVVQNIRGIK